MGTSTMESETAAKSPDSADAEVKSGPRGHTTGDSSDDKYTQEMHLKERRRLKILEN